MRLRCEKRILTTDVSSVIPSSEQMELEKLSLIRFRESLTLIYHYQLHLVNSGVDLPTTKTKTCSYSELHAGGF